MGSPLENISQLRLTRAVPADAAAVRQLVRDAYAKWVPVFGREPTPMTADYDLAVRQHQVDLLHIDDALVAVIEMIIRPDDLLLKILQWHLAIIAAVWAAC